MPYANVRGINMNYQILGSTGPWAALSPGGRRDISGIQNQAGKLADLGYRVVIFDRRNCGASDVVIDGNDSEYEIWADDVHELLNQLGALPAIVGGSSSGCRTALLFALRHPESVRALLLWRITGGRFACERLAEEYYGQFITAAKSGGMAAVCGMEHWQERIKARPENRNALMRMDPQHFIRVMSRWREYFLKGADLPVIGATEADLRSIKVPACIIPGNDLTHGQANRRNPRPPVTKERSACAVPHALRRTLESARGMGRQGRRDGGAVQRLPTAHHSIGECLMNP